MNRKLGIAFIVVILAFAATAVYFSLMQKAKIENESDAINLAKNYVLSYYEQAEGASLILNNVVEIPYTPGLGGEDPQNYSEKIQPPEVNNINGKYYVKLYSWYEGMGTIYEWGIEVSETGEISGQKTKIAKYVGNFIGIE